MEINFFDLPHIILRTFRWMCNMLNASRRAFCWNKIKCGNTLWVSCDLVSNLYQYNLRGWVYRIFVAQVRKQNAPDIHYDERFHLYSNKKLGMIQNSAQMCHSVHLRMRFFISSNLKLFNHNSYLHKRWLIVR